MEKRKKKIFWASYGGVHANIAKLLYPALIKEYDVCMLALTVSDKIFDKAKVKYNKIQDYFNVFDGITKQQILQYGNSLAHLEYNTNSGMLYEDCVAYIGCGIWDLVQEYKSEDYAYKMYRKYGRKCFCPTRVMEAILQEEKPDIVILTSNVRYERATGLAANNLGIPVLHIHDLPEMSALAYKADICVMNEYAREYVLSNNLFSLEQVHVTGQPVFEDNITVDMEMVEKVRSELRVKDYKSIVTYLEQPLNEDTEAIEAFLQKQAKEHPENLYIAKLHPNQDFEEMDVGISNYLKTKNIDLKSILFLSTVAITKDSNSGLEAALMGRNLIVVGIKEVLRLDFSKFGIAIKVSSIDNLECALQDLVTKKDDNKLLEARKKFRNKENATANILSVIREIIYRAEKSD